MKLRDRIRLWFYERRVAKHRRWLKAAKVTYIHRAPDRACNRNKVQSL